MTHHNPTTEKAITNAAADVVIGTVQAVRNKRDAIDAVTPYLRSLVATVERETVERAAKIAEQPRIFDAMSGACGVPPYGAETAGELRSLLSAPTQEEKP